MTLPRLGFRCGESDAVLVGFDDEQFELNEHGRLIWCSADQRQELGRFRREGFLPAASMTPTPATFALEPQSQLEVRSGDVSRTLVIPSGTLTVTNTGRSLVLGSGHDGTLIVAALHGNDDGWQVAGQRSGCPLLTLALHAAAPRPGAQPLADATSAWSPLAI